MRVQQSKRSPSMKTSSIGWSSERALITSAAKTVPRQPNNNSSNLHNEINRTPTRMLKFTIMWEEYRKWWQSTSADHPAMLTSSWQYWVYLGWHMLAVLLLKVDQGGTSSRLSRESKSDAVSVWKGKIDNQRGVIQILWDCSLASSVRSVGDVRTGHRVDQSRCRLSG